MNLIEKIKEKKGSVASNVFGTLAAVVLVGGLTIGVIEHHIKTTKLEPTAVRVNHLTVLNEDLDGNGKYETIVTYGEKQEPVLKVERDSAGNFSARAITEQEKKDYVYINKGYIK